MGWLGKEFLENPFLCSSCSTVRIIVNQSIMKLAANLALFKTIALYHFPSFHICYEFIKIVPKMEQLFK